MTEVATRVESLRIALVGVPNCGKTALFNRLTGSRQKVANYPGVTVERKEGTCRDVGRDRQYRVLDLPGAYSLAATTLDEAITRDVVTGRLSGEEPPELIVNVLDESNLRLSLRLTLELKRLGRPMIAVLNMSDIAHKRGIHIDRARLAAELGCPVVETVAVKSGGEHELLDALADLEMPERYRGGDTPDWVAPTREAVEATQREVRRILGEIGYREPLRTRTLANIDAVAMNPIAGPLLLAALLFLIFQAVFSWAEVPMNLIEAGVSVVGQWLGDLLPAGPLRSLVIDGVFAGVSSVLVFLPQILILFFFILVLEDSGYLPRAAFLLDRLMGFAGLSGRAFIPLLSSFACAIPGIMAARTIPNMRDRLATILLAPLMTCSARLPVYALIIAAFIPERGVGIFNLQGIVLFALYLAGIVGALLVALVMKKFTLRSSYHPLLMELPEYRWPNLRNLLMGLWERVQIFLSRVGTIILALMIVLWFLSSYPAPPPGATGPRDRIQHRRHARPRVQRRVRADRLQLADLHRAGARPRRARSGRQRPRHGVCAERRFGGHRARNADRALLEPRHGALAARLVRVCAAVPLDARHGEARDQFLALSGDHGGVSLRHGLRRGVHHLPRRAVAELGSTGMQQIAVVVIVIAAAVYAAYRLPGAATRLRYAAGLKRDGPAATGRVGRSARAARDHRGWLQGLRRGDARHCAQAASARLALTRVFSRR